MKRMKKLCLVLSSLVVLGGLVGCNSVKTADNNEEDIIYYSLSIDGKKIKIDEEDKEIKEIIDITKLYINASTSSDYTKEYSKEEFTYYTEEKQKMYEEYGVVESTAALIANNKLMTNISDLTMTNIEVYTVNRIEHSQATIEFITVTDHATPEYLEQRKIELGVKYKRTAIVELIKEDGKWKIEKLVNISEREKVE